MELTWIEDFLALTRTQNFTLASAQRFTTQPAFSRRIQQLEEWLGTMLFDRTARPIRLTVAGEEFYKRAERIREDILDARRITMAVQSNYQQAVRVYTTVPIALGVLPEWLATHDTHNHTIITSSVAGCTEALRQKRADQILVPWFKDDVADNQFTYTKVADDCLAPFELGNTKAPVTLKNKKLVGSLLMYTPGTVLGQQVAKCWERHGVEPAAPSVCEGAAAETLLALVEKGFGAAWLPQSMVRNGKVGRCDVPDKLSVPFGVMLVARAV